MPKKGLPPRLLLLFLITALLFSLLTVYAFSEEKPSVSARAAALYEPKTKTVLYEKNADLRLPMASTTKIMTALVVAESLPPEREVKIDPRAVGTEGSSLYLTAGEVLTVRELLYGLMLRSANDAAEALAYEVAGSLPAFAALMNERSEELGLVNTHFETPHGLDAPTHYTTARELALITAVALENAEIARIVSTYKTTLGTDPVRLVVNHNRLLTSYEGAVGVKTGYTKKSGRCLVGAATRDGLTLISVTLDAPNDWSDHTRLLDYGFSLMECRTLLLPREIAYSLPVIGGSAERVSVENAEGFSYIAKRSDPLPTREIRLSRYVSAPLAKGETRGAVVFRAGDAILGEVPLLVTEAVPLAKKKKSIFS